jgi:hypothetical protein
MTDPPQDRASPAAAVIGLACALLGAAGLVGLVTLLNCTTDACNTWNIRLRLTGSLLVSAGLQLMVLLGAWTVWRARRPKG